MIGVQDELFPIKEYEGKYSITRNGKIWSHERIATSKRRKWKINGRWSEYMNEDDE